MLFIKGLGLSIYYRLRRMSKALKNWRKFGVIMFGGIFLAASMFPYMVVPTAIAADSLRVEIVDANGLAISSFGIEPGKTKQFTARSYDQNNQDITNKTSFLWSIDGKYSTSQVGNVTQTGLFTSGPKAGLYSGALRLLG
ncbi:MAG: hypothetical protein WC805_00180, partial [Patescibacteria group bacterium]